MSDPKRTWLRNADFVVAWNETSQRHHYLLGGDLVFAENEISFVGQDYSGTAEQVIDCAGRMIMPGLVNIHAHPSSTLEGKGLIEEVGTLALGSSLLYDYYKMINLPAPCKRANLTAAMAELLKGGSTTVVDISYVPSTGTYPAVDGWIETMAASGIRAYAGAQAADAIHWTPDGHSATYKWNTDNGRDGLKEAVALVEKAISHSSGRIGGILAAGQADTCTPELLRDMKKEAEALKIPLSIHASQSPAEFREMIDRTGRTPVQWLNDIDFIDERTVLAHCLFIDDHPQLHWPKHEDRRILADSGATVAHCPWIQAKNGRLMHSFASYLRDGVNVGIGTDCSPMNMIEEMRWVAAACRIAEEYRLSTTTEEVLNAATINGARALGRHDIGRLATGCKADILSVDLSEPQMQPIRDPLRSLIFYAQERPLREVWVDGVLVVKDGECITIDHHAALRDLQPGFDEMLSLVPKADHAGRTADEAFPLSLDVVRRPV